VEQSEHTKYLSSLKAYMDVIQQLKTITIVTSKIPDHRSPQTLQYDEKG
jgi:hypothetical protein